MRPRQVRYQAALRPDILRSLHSKLLLELAAHADEGIRLIKTGPGGDPVSTLTPLIPHPQPLIRFPNPPSPSSQIHPTVAIS